MPSWQHVERTRGRGRPPSAYEAVSLRHGTPEPIWYVDQTPGRDWLSPALSITLKDVAAGTGGFMAIRSRSSSRSVDRWERGKKPEGVSGSGVANDVYFPREASSCSAPTRRERGGTRHTLLVTAADVSAFTPRHTA